MEAGAFDIYYRMSICPGFTLQVLVSLCCTPGFPLQSGSPWAVEFYAAKKTKFL
jgi:hypothetical protein